MIRYYLHSIKNILTVSFLLLISVDCLSQNDIQKAINDIDRIVNSMNYKNKYTFIFNDSIRFKHPYITQGKSLGMLIVKNNIPPNCELKYFIIEYSNRDSISYQIFRFYHTSSASVPSPFEPIFYYGKFVFFMHWHSPYWSDLDDRCKYLSIKIFNDLKDNLKSNAP
jgi:hypothetical protein